MTSSKITVRRDNICSDLSLLLTSLMNVVFSDTFAPRLATLGNAGTRHEVDNSATANDKGFWLDVCRAFIDDNNGYG
jgi:hypothetical protein